MNDDTESCHNLEPLINQGDTSPIKIASDHEFSIKEKARECFKPRYQPRRVKNRGAILVLIWSFLASAMYFYTSHLTSRILYLSSTVLNAVQIFMGLAIPLAGWLADVRFGRYKVICFCIRIMWISSLLLTTGLVIVQYWEIHKFRTILLIFLIPLGMGFCGFQVNIIQFGVDQLYDASSSEIKTYVIWYSWTYIASISAVGTAVLYIGDKYKILASLLVCLNLTLAMSLGILFNSLLIKEPVTQNPFKTVFGVIKYAIKHKSPRQRSAFTYGEDELPSRIDFGKNKYGGPFTTEQVEDVKTLFRVLLVALLGCALYGFTIEERSIKTNLRNTFINNISRSPKYVFSNFYSIIAPILIPLYEIIIHPLFNRCLPNLKSYKKTFAGIVIRFARYVILLVLFTYVRHHYERLDDTSPLSNVTLPCIFKGNPWFLVKSLDYRWTVLLEILLAISDSLILVGSLEFYCAQVPYSMKGLVAGILYSFIGIFMMLSQELLLPFTTKSLEWGTGTLSCGFWYILMILIYLVIVMTAVVIVMRWYKKRKREDVLPNEQIFAERYYSRYL